MKRALIVLMTLLMLMAAVPYLRSTFKNEQ